MPITIGAKVTRRRGQFAGRPAIVVAGDGPTWLIASELGGGHYLGRVIHQADLAVVDAGPFPLPVCNVGVAGTI